MFVCLFICLFICLFFVTRRASLLLRSQTIEYYYKISAMQTAQKPQVQRCWVALWKNPLESPGHQWLGPSPQHAFLRFPTHFTTWTSTTILAKMSFIPITPEHHFPIQNLPYGIFSTPENVSMTNWCWTKAFFNLFVRFYTPLRFSLVISSTYCWY